MNMKNICVLVLVSLAVIHTQAQETTIRPFMQKAMQAYRNAAYLDFQVMYRYANKNQPGNYIDSLAGEIAMDKNRMRFLIDDVETISNGEYTIRIVRDEKLIYLAKASAAAVTDPVSMLDSALAHINGVQAGLTHNNQLATLNLRFPPGNLYKTIAMTMDESTGYFEKVVYELYTTGFVGQDQIDQPGKPAPYQEEGQVEILFSKYRKGGFTDALFSETQYFTRLGAGKYEPSEQYKDYRIFLATSNL